MEHVDAELLKIGELARLTGLPVKRIHYYERRGLLKPSARSETGYRLYGAEEVARLEFIKRAKLLGLTLEEIRELVGLAARCNEGEIVPRLEEVLEVKLEETARKMDELAAFRDNLLYYRERAAALSGGVLPTDRYCEDVSIFPRMRRIQMLLCLMVLPAIFLMVGCTGGGSQGEQGHATQSGNVKLDLRPEHDSGVSGTASFEDTSGGVVVKLDLRNLPKPNTFYLAHIHPGTCAEGEGYEHSSAHGAEGHTHQHGEEFGHEHGAAGHEHGGGAAIEYPLSQVKSDSEGHGSSTTTLHETSVDKLFSGETKHVNVHEAGSGNPPILTCADLKRAG